MTSQSGETREPSWQYEATLLRRLAGELDLFIGDAWKLDVANLKRIAARMGSKPENPFAFPSPEMRSADGQGIFAPILGMTMRDYFAGQALQGFLADGSQRHINEAIKESREASGMVADSVAMTAIVNGLLAEGAYALADAMLAARQP